MDVRPLQGRAVASPVRVALTGLVLFASAIALAGFASAAQARDRDADPVPLTVPKATCGPNDHPETGLQGQVPAPLRAAGFHGFNCNLELIGQSRGDGATWQTTEFRDEHHICAYYGTSFNSLNRTHLGVPTIDVTNPRDPTP